MIELGNLTIWAGGASRGVRPEPGWIVLDLAGQAQDDVVFVRGPKASKFSRTRKYSDNLYTVVDIYWRDYSTPDLPFTFWDDIIADLLDLAKTKPVNVLVMCMGGHGRTGTALAILAALLGVVPPGTCPVAWVREHYCDEAVETKGQLQYVEDMSGWAVTSQEAKKPYYAAAWKGNTTKTNSVVVCSTLKPEDLPIKDVDDLPFEEDQPWVKYGMTKKDWEELGEEDDSKAFWKEYYGEYGMWP